MEWKITFFDFRGILIGYLCTWFISVPRCSGVCFRLRWYLPEKLRKIGFYMAEERFYFKQHEGVVPRWLQTKSNGTNKIKPKYNQ
jgi:hypothetical protein